MNSEVCLLLSIVVPMVDWGGGQGEVKGTFVPVPLTAEVTTMWGVHWCVNLSGDSAVSATSVRVSCSTCMGPGLLMLSTLIL